VDFSRLRKWEAIGAIGAALGALTLFLLPWYSIDPNVPGRMVGNAAYSADNWICGARDLHCAPGEITMTVGITGFVLIAYNGLLDKPGTGSAEIGVSLAWGYWFALLVGILIAFAGFKRSQEGQHRVRKAPGNV